MINTDEPLESVWPTSLQTEDLATRIEAIESSVKSSSTKQHLTDKTQKLMRDIHFVRGMAVLRAWRQLDGDEAHDIIQKNLDLSLSRLARVYEIDPEFVTAVLVVGLLKYYLYPSNDEEHQEGINLLKFSQQMGMNDPETRKILFDIEEREKERKNAVDQYIWLLDRYLNDATVQKEVRIALLEKLVAFQRIQDWDNQPDLADSETVEPTLADMRRRSEMLMVRVEELLRTRSESDDAVQEIEKKARYYKRQVKHFNSKLQQFRVKKLIC